MIPIIEFVLGIAVLVYSAEKLIGYLVGVASRWAISLFLIAVVFTGIEFDDLAFGIVLNLEDLSKVALGTVIGTTVAMTGIVLAVAAIIAPSPVDVPNSYLVLFVAAPVVMYALAFTGALTLVTGVVLHRAVRGVRGLDRLPRVLRAAPGVPQRRALRADRRSRSAPARRRRDGHGDPDRRGDGDAPTGGGTGGAAGSAASTCRPTCASTRASSRPGSTRPASPSRSRCSR